MGVPIKGVEKLSTIDYPGKTCSVAFLPGCNFRCPFCQNPDLIERPGEMEGPSEEEFLDFIRSRRKWLDGVCVTGGEPTLHEGLPGFMRKLKSEGFLVKLDTNGTNPRMIEGLLREGLLDYVAMDIKGPPERYGEVAASEVDMGKIRESIGIIMDSGTDYEFRTTAAPGLVRKEDMEGIGKLIRGARRFFVQGFRPENCMDRSFRKLPRVPEEDLKDMAKIVRGFVKNVGVRA